MKKDPDECLINQEAIDEGALTEDQYLDFNLDRNYQYKDENLIHNLNNIGWDDPFENVEFEPMEKKELNAFKRRKKDREKEDRDNANLPEPEYVPSTT